MFIGIDLGTTSSEAAFVDDKKEIQIIPASEGSFGGKNFPSVVGFKDKEIIVGWQAKRLPIEKFAEFKRAMGTDKKFYSETLDKWFTPQELSAFVLRKIKEDAEKYLNEEITGAVITVPAYFDDNQRQATKDAAKIAGIDCKRIINEPTAAAMAYGFKGDENIKVAVLDLGGGTFDVTIMEIADGVFQVLSTSGDTKLGGCDMDDLLYKYIINNYLPDNADVDDYEVLMIKEMVERAKMELSSVTTTTIYVPRLFNVTITRSEFEKVIKPVLDRLKAPIFDALKGANLTQEEIDRVILVGGATKVPAVRNLFEDIFGKEKIAGGVDPMRAVAMGAAIQAAILEGKLKSDVLLVDVLPLSLGVEIKDGLMSKIIERNTPIPIKASKIFTTVYDNQTAVRVKVFQGEREFTKDNVYLGELLLDGILPAPAGVPRIEVTFEVDENGIIIVTAKDLGTEKERTLKIEAPHRLSDDELKRIIEEAEKLRDEDMKGRELIELKNKAHMTIDFIDVALKKVDGQIKSELVEAKLNLERSVSSNNNDEIKHYLNVAEDLLRKAAEQIYGS